METPFAELLHYLNGQASEAEVALVEEWKTGHPEEFQRWKMVWEESGQLSDNELPDLDTSWRQVEGKLGLKKAKERKLIWPKLTRIAAAILLLLAAAGAWWGLQPVTYMAEAGNEKVELPDGSKVWLLQGSEIAYQRINWGKRQVELTGEAFFEVERNEAKPFVVATGPVEVKVLGTSFNVISPKGAEEQRVQVNSGKVAFYRSADPEDRLELLPGEEGIIWKERDQPVKQPIVDENYRAWHTQSIVFDTTPLPKVFSTLGKAYGVAFEMVAPEQMGNCLINAKFEQQPLEVVMEVLQTLYNLKIEAKEDGRYEVTGEPCGP